MSKLVVTLSVYLLGVYSAPCIPANTCFPTKVGDSSTILNTAADEAVMWTCDENGRVTKNLWNTIAPSLGTEYNKGECDRIGVSSFNDIIVNANGVTGAQSAGPLHTGMVTDGSGSGTVTTDYLQGLDCPNIDTSSNTCTDYMVIKRYGNVGWISPVNGDELAYQDIGRGNDDEYEEAQGTCQGKETGTYAEADFFVIPFGCVNLYTGSLEYYITDDYSAWGYLFYVEADCPTNGETKTAQSDEWSFGCNTFAERTHCSGQFNSPQDPVICSTGGVLVTYDYDFELVCAPNTAIATAMGKQTCASFYASDVSQSNAPSKAPTPQPATTPINTCPSCPGGTDAPTQAGDTKAPTPAPVSSGGPSGNPSGTDAPTRDGETRAPTPSPNSSGGPSGGPSGTPAPSKSSAMSMQFIMTIIIGTIFALIM